MAVNIKLGANVFSKERKIADLENQVLQLQAKLQYYEAGNKDLETKSKSYETGLMDMKHLYEISEIENQQLKQAATKNSAEIKSLNERLQQSNKGNCEMKERVKELMNLCAK